VTLASGDRPSLSPRRQAATARAPEIEISSRLGGLVWRQVAPPYFCFEGVAQAALRTTPGRLPMREEHFAILRRHMVEVIGIYVDLGGDELGKRALDERVLAAMGRVPRHAFVPEPLTLHAYQDTPLPIGFDKTISQPFMVALMLDLLEPRPDDVVLEVGTGLGYQAALLSQLVHRVWSVEIIEELAAEAKERLRQQGYDKVGIRIGDGALGWADHAPFDKIIVTAAAELAPPALIQQLKPGGRMVLPTGAAQEQKLTVVEKDSTGRTHLRELMSVRFGLLETVR
jgi:protein-L-isoaspartate(D-aspartate) O-methyltransferase